MTTFSDKILDPTEGVRPSPSGSVDERDRRHGAQNGCAARGAHPSADRQEQVDGSPFTPRGQEVAGAVRDSNAQTPDRHLRTDLADRGCVDEARSARRGGCRDQGVRQGARVGRDRDRADRESSDGDGDPGTEDRHDAGVRSRRHGSAGDGAESGPVRGRSAQAGRAGRVRSGSARTRRGSAGTRNQTRGGRLRAGERAADARAPGGRPGRVG